MNSQNFLFAKFGTIKALSVEQIYDKLFNIIAEIGLFFCCPISLIPINQQVSK